jgi:hypothetical protein
MGSWRHAREEKNEKRHNRLQDYRSVGIHWHRQKSQSSREGICWLFDWGRRNAMTTTVFGMNEGGKKASKEWFRLCHFNVKALRESL